MKPKDAYRSWSEQYDTNINKTRDLEGFALRKELESISFNNCLEIGCGTGKNTEWLLTKSEKVTAIDISPEMISKAKEKIRSDKVNFIQVDINKEWNFSKEKFDLISFSLVLEHIEDLDHIFYEISKALSKEGHVYIGELHPFKQYTGTKARFETAEGIQLVTCFDHNISDFINSAKKNGLIISEIDEYFDNEEHIGIPRILTLIFQNK
ncbi:MAG: class I SAM-dependent methyltransferase [Ignavibacteria bacterium]